MIDQTQEKMLERIRALLAQAESTTFPAEAEAFFAKAHELMLKYAIDEAMLRQAKGNAGAADIVVRVVSMPGRVQLIKAKRELLHFVALSNRCKAFVTGRNGRGDDMLVVGFRMDTEFVEMLYTSILAQMTAQCEKATRARSSSVNANVFRNNFAHGYAARILTRLRDENNKMSIEQSGALVLYKGEVDDWIAANMVVGTASNAGTKKRQFDHDARSAGDAAARTADISGGRSRTHALR